MSGVAGVIVTIILVPIFFGLRIGLQDFLRGIGQDRRYRKAQDRAIDREVERNLRASGWTDADIKDWRKHR